MYLCWTYAGCSPPTFPPSNWYIWGGKLNLLSYWLENGNDLHFSFNNHIVGGVDLQIQAFFLYLLLLGFHAINKIYDGNVISIILKFYLVWRCGWCSIFGHDIIFSTYYLFRTSDITLGDTKGVIYSCPTKILVFHEMRFSIYVIKWVVLPIQAEDMIVLAILLRGQWNFRRFMSSYMALVY